MPNYLGLDPTMNEKKATAFAVLDGNGRLVDAGTRRADAELLALAKEFTPAVVAIDAPLGFPKGMDCLEQTCACESEHGFKGRVCERRLIERGIGLYVTTKRSIIKEMVYRAMRLAEEYRRQHVEVIEVYPYAAKVMLFGKPLPKKSKPEGIRFMRERLPELVPGLEGGRLSDHDVCDAALAAYTGYLHANRQAEALGLAEEAQIVVPKQRW